MATDGFIQLPPDSTGKKMQTFVVTVGPNQVHDEAKVLVDPEDGSPLAIRLLGGAHVLEVLGRQGDPGALADAWPVKVTDGVNVFGSPGSPLNVTGTVAIGGPVSVTVTNFPATQPVTGTVTANQGTGGGAGLAWSQRLSDGVSFYDTVLRSQLPAALLGGRLDVNLGSWLGSAAPTVGQKTAAASLPVVLASDQGPLVVSGSVVVSGTVTADVGNPGPLALDATLTGGSQTTRITDGVETAAVTAPNTAPALADPALVVAISPNTPVVSTNASVGPNASPAPGSSTQIGGSDGADLQAARVYDVDAGAGAEFALGVVLRAGAPGGSVEAGTASDPLRVDPTGATPQPVTDGGGSLTVDGSVAVTNFPAVQPVSAASLPLPTGAATEATLATRVADATVTARLNTLGQKAMAASAPVVIASDQSPIDVNLSAPVVVTGPIEVDQGAGGVATDPWIVQLSDGAATYDAARADQLPAALVGGRLDANLGAWLGSTAPTVGQKTSADSLPVVLASDQPDVPVSVASLPLPAGAATEATLATRLADATFTARVNTLGQKTSANSTPVVLASDQSAVPVTDGGGSITVDGTVTANIGTTGGLALDATLTGGAQRARVTDGVSDAAVKPASTAPLATDPALVVAISPNSSVSTTNASVGANGAAAPAASTQVGGSDGAALQAARVFDLDTGAGAEYDLGVSVRLPGAGGSVAGGTAANPLRTDPTGTTTQPVSAASLPLPAGAATEATLAGVLTTAAFQARINTLGQKTSANSTPVVLASDQSAVPVSDGGGSITVDGTVAVSNFPAVQPVSDNGGSLTVDTPQLPAALVGGRLDANVGGWLGSTAPTVGAKTSANSLPVVLASDQAALPVTDNGGSLTVDGTVAVSNFPATQPVSGTVTANQGSPAAVANAWPIKVSDGVNTAGLTNVSGAQALKVDVVQTVGGGGGSNASVGTTNAAVPGSATLVGGRDRAGLLQPPSLDNNEALVVARPPAATLGDPFDGTAIDAEQWNALTVDNGGGGPAPAVTVAAGVATVSAGTGANNYAFAQSLTTFSAMGSGGIEFVADVKIDAAAVANTGRFWGLGTLAGSPIPTDMVTDGVGFLVTPAGVLQAYVRTGGADLVTTALVAPTDAAFHRYWVVVRTNAVEWYLDSRLAPVATASFKPTQTTALPALLLSAVANSNAPSTATLQANFVGVSDTSVSGAPVADAVYPWRRTRVSKNGILAAASMPQIIQAGGITAAYAGVPDGQVALASTTVTAVRATAWTEPGAVAQRSVVSSSAQDKAGGTGATSVRITYYTNQFQGPKTVDIVLNGTTPVNTVVTDIFYVNSIEVIGTVANHTQTNVGTITLFAAVAGGGAALGTIAVGANRTFWAHHYFGVSMRVLIGSVSGSAKGNSVNFFLRAWNGASTNTAERQISPVLRSTGAQETMPLDSPLVLDFPSGGLVTMYAQADSTTAATAYGSFSYYEVPD